MKWTMAAATLAACLGAPVATAVAEPIELQWWHAMTSVNADRVNKIRRRLQRIASSCSDVFTWAGGKGRNLVFN
jgi:hypothetical protein